MRSFIVACLLLWSSSALAADSYMNSFLNITTPPAAGEYWIETADGSRNITQASLDAYYLGLWNARYSLLGHIHNYLSDAPSNGSEYVRKNGAWSVVTPGGTTVNSITCTGTDKLISFNSTTGNFVCGADQLGAAGSGITSLNGAEQTSQSFVGGTNVTITTDPLTGIHTFSATDTNTDDQTATEVSVTDAGSYYSGTNVETVLQEIGPTMTNARTPTTHTHNYEPADATIIKESELSNATNSASITTAANSAAVKSAYDLAAGKQSPATTLAGYGISDAVPSSHLNDSDPHTGYMLESNIGTTANKYVQLDGNARLPAVDGSQLTNLPSTSVNADWSAISGAAQILNKPNTLTLLGGLTPTPGTPALFFWNGSALVLTDQLAVSEVDLPTAGAYKVGGEALTAADIGAEPANANIQTHIGTTGNPHGLTITDIGSMERALDPYALKFYYGPPQTAGTCNDEETSPSAQAVASKNAWMGIGWPEANLVWICRDITAFTLLAQESYSLTYSDAGTMTLAGGSLIADESYSLTYSDVGSMSLEGGGGGEFTPAESFSLTYSDNGDLTLAGGSLFAQESYSLTYSDNGTIQVVASGNNFSELFGGQLLVADGGAWTSLAGTPTISSERLLFNGGGTLEGVYVPTNMSRGFYVQFDAEVAYESTLIVEVGVSTTSDQTGSYRATFINEYDGDGEVDLSRYALVKNALTMLDEDATTENNTSRTMRFEFPAAGGVNFKVGGTTVSTSTDNAYGTFSHLQFRGSGASVHIDNVTVGSL